MQISPNLFLLFQCTVIMLPRTLTSRDLTVLIGGHHIFLPTKLPVYPCKILIGGPLGITLTKPFPVSEKAQ